MKLDYTKLLSKLSEKGRYSFFAAVGIVGILLIMISELEFPTAEPVNDCAVGTETYCRNLEKQVTELLKEIDGVGQAKVMITLESGQENIYVQQQRSSEDMQSDNSDKDGYSTRQSTFENEIVVISGQNGDEALVEKTITPSVQGVAVVCSGADDISVVGAVTNTVSVVFGIPTNRIYVTKMR